MPRAPGTVNVDGLPSQTRKRSYKQVFLNAVLADGKYTPRAVSRSLDSDASKALIIKGVEVVVDNLFDKESLKKAIRGSEAVFGVTNFYDSAVFTAEDRTGGAEITQGKNLVDAAKEEGVEFFIWSELHLDLRLSSQRQGAVEGDKAAVADYLKASGVPHAVLQTGIFGENLWTFVVPTWKGILPKAENGTGYTLPVPYAVARLHNYADPSKRVLGTKYPVLSFCLTHTELADHAALKKDVKFVPVETIGMPMVDEMPLLLVMTERAHPLEIPEIVAHICSQIVNNQPGRRDLAALARTAKIFQDGALNGIWQWQGTFAHILRLMPPDLWNMQVADGFINVLELVRPITTADWERPLFYLHRVRTFNACNLERLPSPELFESLSSSCPREHLFPNLRFLTWTHNQSRSSVLYPYIHAFLGPRLNQLDLRIPHLPSDLSVFPDIAFKCPELTDVEIGGESWSSDHRQQFRPKMSLFLRSLNRIQKLHIASFGVDGPTFDHLATTSMFKSLYLGGFRHDGLTSRLSQPGDGARFTQLTSLKVLHISVEAASDIFRCCPPLASIDIGIFPVAGIEAISDLYRTITDNLQRTPLRSLTISNTRAGGPLNSLAFPPLLIFHNLTTVKLRNDYAFVLDDMIAHQMARAWPNLQSLDLLSHCPPANSDPPRVTLAALCIFAEHCPALRLLGIDINALTVPPGNDFHFRRPTPVTLLVGYAPIKDPSAVADFIFAVYPNVSGFLPRPAPTLTLEERQQLCDRWEVVEENLAQKRRVSS
ncbi:NmrA-like family-domain-containing protein [Mycena polygramma]|nr:NmrA-like family-domain-containing protein [Mycena polygramma]